MSDVNHFDEARDALGTAQMAEDDGETDLHDRLVMRSIASSLIAISETLDKAYVGSWG